jgi:hypothetical protein
MNHGESPLIWLFRTRHGEPPTYEIDVLAQDIGFVSERSRDFPGNDGFFDFIQVYQQ